MQAKARLFLLAAALLLPTAFAQTQISIGLFPDLDSHVNAVIEQF